MTDKAPRLDRVAFALLLPSLAVPIAATLLAVWRSFHIDAGPVGAEIDLRPFVTLAVAMVLCVAFASAVLNAILLLRRQSSFEARALRPRRAAFHYLEIAVLLAASGYFAFDATGAATVFVAPVVIGLAVTSFVALLQTPSVGHKAITAFPLTRSVRLILAGHFLTFLAVIVLVVASVDSDGGPLYVAIGLMLFLGLPWSGVSALLWVPVALVAAVLAPVFVPISVFALASAPALYNLVLSVMFAVSEDARVEIVNKLYGVGAKRPRPTLGA